MQFKPSRLFAILILSIGALFYIQNIIVGEFFISSSILFTSLIVWLLFTLVFDEFDNHFFYWLLFFSGMLLTIGVFLSYGIEEIPYPEGAHVFHMQGVSISLLLLFASLLPLILLSKTNHSTINNINKKIERKPSMSELKNHNDLQKNADKKFIVEDENWEQASKDDLESGKFETI